MGEKKKTGINKCFFKLCETLEYKPIFYNDEYNAIYGLSLFYYFHCFLLCPCWKRGSRTTKQQSDLFYLEISSILTGNEETPSVVINDASLLV